ncbi:MAG: trypsin-like serine peptidase [Usitatibacter sp.]
MGKTLIGRICAAIAAFALAGTALAAEPLSGGGDARAEQIRAEPETQPALAPVPAARARRTTLDAIPNVALDAPTVDAFPGKALFSGEAGTPLQVGFGRPLAALATESAMGWQLAWESLPEGGWIGAVSVTSAAASALRLGLRVEALPPGATLRFHGPGNDEVFEVSAAQVEATIERNFASGEPADAARMFWSPVVESDTVVVEIELARGTSPAGVRIAAPMVSHLLTRASANFVMPKAAASCEIDAMCHQDAWGKESNAVARIIFTKNGSSFVCSGTLLADKDPSTFIPYFLTANHCITSQLVASTMQSYWFYRASACDSGVRGNFQTLFGGATLLYGTTSTDTAFMRLNGTPPAGVAYAGWLASSAPVPSAPVTGIHHPDGDLQKITFGNVASFWTCVPSSSGDFTCNNAPSASATFFTVAWRDGITEPGSSGSGVFLDNGHYLIGQLYGGTNACGTPGGRDWFGRFDIAYNSALYQWLGSTAAAPITPALNYSDMWWNPDESGWGLSITQHSPTIFAAWYIYDSSGRPQWIVMPGGHWTTTTSFTGDLYTATGPDPRGAFDPALVARARVGSGTLAFTASDRATFNYTVDGVPESRQIRRQLFGPVDTPLATNYGDMWWNESESGWGLSISQQYRTLVAVWYAYGADGRALWYVVPSGTWSGSDAYTGTIYRTTAAPNPFFGTSFNAGAVTRTPVGTMTLRFINSANATMTYTIDGVTGAKSITRASF